MLKYGASNWPENPCWIVLRPWQGRENITEAKLGRTNPSQRANMLSEFQQSCKPRCFIVLKYGGIKNHTIDYFVWCIWCFGGGLFELVIPAQGFVASVVSLDSSWWKDLGTMKSVQLGKLHCPRIYLQEFRNPPSKIKRIANSSSLTKPTQCVFQKNIVQLKPWKHWNLPFVFLIRWIKAPPPKRCRRRGAITKAKWWQMFGLCLRPSVCMEIWSRFWLEDDFLAAVADLMPRQRSQDILLSHVFCSGFSMR